MHRAVGLLIIGCGLVLAACGGASHPVATSAAPRPTGVSPTNVSPTATPSSTTSSSKPTPSPTATTPLLTGPAVQPGEKPPVYLKQFNTNDSGGAIYFAGYFYQAIDWSIATSNPNLLRSISAPECRPCQSYIHDIDSLAGTGGHSEGGRLSASAFAFVTGSLVKADYVVKVTIQQGTEVIIDSDGASHTYPAEHGPVVNYLYVVRRAGKWQAVEIGG